MNRHAKILLPLALAALVPLAAVPGAAAAGKGGAEAAAAAPDACALRYHASLTRIGAADLPLLKGAAEAAGAPSAAGAANEALPGFPLFVAPPRQRKRDEIAALTAAVALARTRGRTTSMAGGSGEDRVWLATRLREDLGDYLGQQPTPYLCSGVPAYVQTLRGFAERIGPTADRSAEWAATERRLAEGSVQAAIAAIAAAKRPAPQPAAETDLRPTAGIVRSDAASPPPAPPQPTALADEATLVAAVDRLVADAKEAGLVAEPPAPPVAADGRTPAALSPAPPAAAPPLPRPVLAKLAAAKPLVVSARPLVRDRTVRLKLLAAFSDLEMLDYLMKAGPETPDPVAAAIGRTLADIEAAHAADCTCAAAGAVRP